MPLSPRLAPPLASLLLAAALIAGAPRGGHAQDAPAAATTDARGPEALYEELAHADSIFFDALFARCDAERANAFLAAEVEFYDDRTGLSAGDDLRSDFRRLAANCPASNGVRRILLPESMEVHPIPGYGAVQTGVHHFVERGASTSTIARFHHVWKRTGDGWRLARIVSLHEVVDAARAAALRM